MDRDIVLAKVATIQRCLVRIRQVTALDPVRLDDQNIEDIFVLNLQRAVQAAIDLGAHVLAAEGFDMPATLREIFGTLEQHGTLSASSAKLMQNMCGFRNIAVHDYQTLSKSILKTILTNHLKDLEDFYSEILTKLPSDSAA